jgi:hypothetical protein
VRLDFRDPIGLMHPVEDIIDVFSKIAIQPPDSTRDIEITFESILSHSVRLQVDGWTGGR